MLLVLSLQPFFLLQGPGVDYTPILPFATQYKGLGPAEVKTEELQQSLLGNRGSGGLAYGPVLQSVPSG